MTTQDNAVKFPEYFMPTEEFIRSLKVGDLAPNAFNQAKPVAEIFGQRQDINGNWFVCYYTQETATSRMSNSLKAGELHRHARLDKTSAELDEIERAMRNE